MRQHLTLPWRGEMLSKLMGSYAALALVRLTDAPC